MVGCTGGATGGPTTQIADGEARSCVLLLGSSGLLRASLFQGTPPTWPLAVGRWPLGRCVGPLAWLAAPPHRLAARPAVGGSAGGWRPRAAVGGERLCSMFHGSPLDFERGWWMKKKPKEPFEKKNLIGAGALKPAPNLEHGTRDTTVDATAAAFEAAK